jgi:hypothetical protein
MGSVVHLHSRLRRRPSGGSRPASNGGATIVTCCQCGEPHPIVRLAGGEQRCVTAFFDGTYWFCRNRGCRRAWLDLVESRP